MNLYGSMMFTMEANKENIPPGTQFAPKNPAFDLDLKEPIVLPVAHSHSHQNHPTPKITPKPSPATSLLSDASFLPDSPAVNTSADEAEDDLESTSRKEKSLGLLCQRFLIAMNEETRANGTNEVHLETVARKMNVEKRRIYDIVNVMEALDAMAKTNKSYYQWHGLEKLPKLMLDLQNEAVMEHLPERVLRVEQAMCSFTELSSSSSTSTSSNSQSSSSSSSSNIQLVGSFAPCTSREQENKPAAVKTERSRVDNRDRQGRNSLAQLCRRFLMVLLSNPRNIRKVSLDVASTVLIKDPETEGFEPPSRSRCRRLYDIANVLVALGLIKKVHYLFGTKKIPLFVYCGPEPHETANFDVYTSIERLLSAPQSTPVTPTIKATTDKIVQQLSAFGKRSSSENQLGSTNRSYHKVPKTEPIIPISPHTSSLMMFAELAAAESLRMQNSPIRNMLFPAFLNNHPIRPTCSTLPFARNSPKKPHYPAPMKHSMSNILNENNLKSSSTTAPIMENLKFAPKPTVILDHTTTSPFQLVQQKKQPREKKIFGEIQNFQ